MAGGEEKGGKKLHNNKMIIRMMSMKEGRWRSVWEARQNTLFNHEFTDELMSSPYMWVCDTQCVYVLVCDASTDQDRKSVV